MTDGYAPAPLEGFGAGLNLRDQPDVLESAQALDLLNVEFSERGAVTQRAGYAKFTDTELTNQPDSLAPFYKTDGTKRLVVGNGNRLDALDTTGASTHNVATTASPHFFTRFGGPAAERLYIANGTDNVRYYDGGFTTPAYTGTAPDGKYLAVTPWDNRLLNARRVGTTGGDNPSSVRFSAPGDPHTFDADDWEDLLPGDGEEITGMVTWREFVLVFKETKFFVFYGTGVGVGGDDRLEYRTVSTGVGLIAPRALAVTDQGVFFLDRKGIYMTRGGNPQLVSGLIDPLFLGGPSPYFRSLPVNLGAVNVAAMTWWDQRLHIPIATGVSTTNDLMLVHDPRFGWWSLYSIPASAISVFRIGSAEELVFAYPTGENRIGRHKSLDTSAYTADDMSITGTGGNAISSRWRSGWLDFGTTGEKDIRESKLWGKGQMEYGVYVDWQDSTLHVPITFTSSMIDLFADGTDSTDLFADGSDSTDLFAGPLQTLTSLERTSHRGTLFSVEFRNSTLNHSFSVQRLIAHLRDERHPSVIP